MQLPTVGSFLQGFQSSDVMPAILGSLGKFLKPPDFYNEIYRIYELFYNIVSQF
jgi:hypothetical protein